MRQVIERKRRIGLQIRAARRAAGFPNAETFAVHLGVGVRTVQRWEQADDNISSKTLLRIADATGKPVEFFFTADEVAA